MSRPIHGSRRAGFSMIAVLALIALAAALFVSWSRDVVRRDHACRLAHQETQARWLADSAIARAAAQLASNPEYPGETWRLSADQLAQSYGAEVVITVSAQGEEATLTAEVHLPPGDARRVLHTQSLSIPNPSAEEN